MNKIKTVTVIGANGTMGRNVAGIFASFGQAKVYMVSKTIDKSEAVIDLVCQSVRSESIAKNLCPMGIESLIDCVNKSDLIIECVAEVWEVKEQIHKKISEGLRESNDQFICTCTSGLSVDKLSKLYSNEKRQSFFGLHFFNPPYAMPLCEIIPNNLSDENKFNILKEYADKTLLRTIVKVKDEPAFLANRIGFNFINKAMIFAERYKDNGGIDYIDSVLGSFSGRMMPPLVTADFVGLDICKAIVDNIYKNTNDCQNKMFIFPKFSEKLIENGFLGKKTQAGLYKKYKNGDTVIQLVYDINSNEYREKIDYKFTFAENMIGYLKCGDYDNAMLSLINNNSIEARICVEFLLSYIVYSLYLSVELCGDIHSADSVMATGFNWCPPLSLLEAFESVTDVENLLKDRLDEKFLQEVDIKNLLSLKRPSNYDYRSFLRAK